MTHKPPAASFGAALGDLARGAGATVRLLYVAPPTSNLLDADDRIVAYADRVRFGDPVREILSEAAEFGADFIVLAIGARNRRTLRRHVAERVLLRAEVPVALLRPARHEADAR